MPALQRHRLVWLHAHAWQRVLQAPTADEARDREATACLQHWAAHDLPLVVTRQSGPGLTLGLASPSCWGRRRLFVNLAHEAGAQAIRRIDDFPFASAIALQLPEPQRAAWLALCVALQRCGAAARVFGSYGWQAISGLPQVRDGSDIDLLVAVESVAQADAAAAVLRDAAGIAQRLDGELQLADGAAVAWREWLAWRAGAARQVLVKRLHGAALHDHDWLATMAASSS